MFALIYSSRSEVQFETPQLEELARKAAVKNEQLKITGYLYYRTGEFFQYLEGDEQTVRGLLAIIEADDRHTIQHVLELGEHLERRFSRWSMRYLKQKDTASIGIDDILMDLLKHFRSDAYTKSEVVTSCTRITTALANLHRKEKLGA